MTGKVLTLVGIFVLLGVLAGGATACSNSCAPVPTAAPTATPWVVVVTATFTPQGPTATPTATLAPGQPTPTQVPPTPTQPPSPTPSPTPKCPPEPNKPVIQILSPGSGTRVAVGQTLQIQSQTGDDCSIMAVDLFDNGVLYNRVEFPNRPPFVRLAQPWSSTAVGQHTLSAVAYDSRGNSSAPSSITVEVYKVATQPTVHIDYPTERIVIVAGQDVQIRCTASSQVAIARTDLFERKGGQEVLYTYDGATHASPFYWAPWWRSNDAGDHTLFIRATDVNGGVGQSPDFTIGVADNNPPAVQPSYSSTTLQQGSDLLVHVNAADSKGVVDIKLFVDGNQVAAWRAPDPSVGQSFASVDLWWRQVGPAGGHSAYVFASNTKGQTTNTPPQGINVTPNIPPTPTPTQPPPPTPTPVPTPPPPRALIEQPQNGFNVKLPQTVHFQVRAECALGAPAPQWLTRVELWGYYQGQPQHQLYNTWPVPGQQGSFQGTYDWVPPSAGVVFFYTRAYDNYGQHGDSEVITGYIEPKTTASQPAAPAGSNALATAALLGTLTVIAPLGLVFWRRRAS